MNIAIDRVSTTIIDPPTSAAPTSAAPSANGQTTHDREHDRRRLDDLLRQRDERLARLHAD